jgi:uncharacterized phiE125 gp8 family phage protein
MNLKLITPPIEEPLSLEEAKSHLVSGVDDDIIITSLIKQAREYCEDIQGKKYITQTIEAYLDKFPHGSIEFRNCSPTQSVTSIKYIDKDGVESIFPDTDYSLDNVSFVNKIDLNYSKSWPSDILKPTNGIIITFVAGYGGAANVPESVKWAIILQMRLLYDDYRPDDRIRIEKARDALLETKRVMPI